MEGRWAGAGLQRREEGGLVDLHGRREGGGGGCEADPQSPAGAEIDPRLRLLV